MNVINVGDYIYDATTNYKDGKVTVEHCIVQKVTPTMVKVTRDGGNSAFSYTHSHKRAGLYTSERDALLAYREKTVQLLLVMGRNLTKGHVTLESIDEQLEVRGE